MGADLAGPGRLRSTSSISDRSLSHVILSREAAPRGSAASRDEFIAYLSTQSRLRQWRTRSRACAAIDVIVVTAGAAVCALTAVDVLSTWHASRALVDHQHLSQIMGVVLIPCWVWLLASTFLMAGSRKPRSGWRREQDPLRGIEANNRRAEATMLRRNMYAGRRMPGVLLAIGVLCICLIVTGLALGAAQGSGHVLTGPRYEISTSNLNDGAWTTVSADQYAYWQARFVRLDSSFTLFGLFVIGGSLGRLRLHRTAIAWARATPTEA